MFPVGRLQLVACYPVPSGTGHSSDNAIGSWGLIPGPYSNSETYFLTALAEPKLHSSLIMDLVVDVWKRLWFWPTRAVSPQFATPWIEDTQVNTWEAWKFSAIQWSNQGKVLQAVWLRMENFVFCLLFRNVNFSWTSQELSQFLRSIPGWRLFPRERSWNWVAHSDDSGATLLPQKHIAKRFTQPSPENTRALLCRFPLKKTWHGFKKSVFLKQVIIPNLTPQTSCLLKHNNNNKINNGNFQSFSPHAFP